LTTSPPRRADPAKAQRRGCGGRAISVRYAGCLNLVEPWWKTLKLRALKGRFFETWEQVEEAISRAVDNRNARRPYAWGRRGGHRVPRGSGVGMTPGGYHLSALRPR
jgi:hypothetical protein